MLQTTKLATDARNEVCTPKSYCGTHAAWTQPLGAKHRISSVTRIGTDLPITQIPCADSTPRSMPFKKVTYDDITVHFDLTIDEVASEPCARAHATRCNGVYLPGRDSLSALTLTTSAIRSGLLGVCTTVLKRTCRANGIRRWPQRKLHSITKMMTSLDLTLQTCGARALPEERSRETRRTAQQCTRCLARCNAAFALAPEAHRLGRTRSSNTRATSHCRERRRALGRAGRH